MSGFQFINRTFIHNLGEDHSISFTCHGLRIIPPPGGGYSLYWVIKGGSPERGPFFKLAVYQRVGKIAILVYERVTKSAAKWKKWWLKRSISKLAVYKRVGKIAILVYERVTKSAAKWKKWWLKRSISKDATFWQE